MIQTEIVVHDELVGYFQVIGMNGELFVELWGHCAKFWQVIPRNGWEIMMFDVITDV
jgi:hypothetical protein